MTSRLTDDQIREALRRRARTPAPEDLRMSILSSAGETRQRPPRRSWWQFGTGPATLRLADLAAVVALLAALVAAAIFVGGQRHDALLTADASPSPTPAVAVPTPATTPALTFPTLPTSTPLPTPVGTGSWSTLAVPDAVATGQLNDLVSSGGAFVGVGTDAADPARAIAWWSADGLEWERNEIGPGEASAVATGGAGVVAVGSAGFSSGDAVTWFSPDGRSWSAAAPLPGQPAHECYVLGARSVAAGPDGFLVFGDVIDALVGSQSCSTAPAPMAWFSPDGRTWSAASVPAQAEILAVTAVPAGFVASGYALNPEWTEGKAAIWASPDGLTWTNTFTSQDPGTLIDSLAFDGRKLLAVEATSGTSTRVLTSTDGAAWTTIHTFEAEAPRIISLKVAGGRYYGSALADLGDGSGFRLSILVTADGSAWSPGYESSGELKDGAFVVAGSSQRLVAVVTTFEPGVDTGLTFLVDPAAGLP